jgi:TP901 family phage tail tape measure protein
MATSLFDLVGRVIVTGTEQFNRSISQVEGKTLSLAGKLDALSVRSQKIGSALTKNVTLPIVAVGAAVIKTGADFDKAMTRSLSIVDGVSGDMRRQFEATALTISKNTTFSATEAAESIYYLASAGLDANKVMRTMGIVAKYAQAGEIELKDAAEDLTDVIGALGLNTDDTTQYYANMTRASDVLTKASVIAEGTIQEFADAIMNHAGAALRVLHKDMEEGVAVLAAFASQGLKGAEAGNALHIVLRDLQSASLRNQDAWSKLGLSVYDASGKMKNTGDIIAMLEQALDGMNDKQVRQTLLMLGFQDRSVKYIMSLLGMSDAIKSYEQSLRSSNGYTEQVAKATTMDFWSQMKILRNQLEAVAITLWQTLGPALKDYVIPAMQQMVTILRIAAQMFNAMPSPVRNLVYALVALAAIVGPTALLFSSLLKFTVFLLPAFVGLKAALAATWLIMAAHPIGLLLTAIGLLLVAGYDLIRTYGGVKNSFNVAWGGMRDFVRAAVISMLRDIVNFVESTLRFFKKMADHPVAKLLGLDVFSRHIANALSWIERFKNSTSGMFGQAKREAESFGGSFKKASMDASDGVKAMETSIQGANYRVPTSGKSGFQADIGEMNKSREDFGNGFNGLQSKMKVRIPEGEKSGFKADMSELSSERQKFETEWSGKVLEQSGNRLAILRREKEQALAEARRLGASRLDIIRYYDQEERKIHNERMMEFVTTTQSIVNTLMGAWNDYTSARIAQIDKKAQREIQAIRDSSISEEEKARKIRQIENNADNERVALQRKQARREKALAIFNAVINGAVAFTKALTLGPVIGWILAAMIAASVGAQIALIMAKPLPFAKGGLVKGNRGGVTAQVGEGQSDEIVFPLKDGISALVDALIEEVNGRQSMVSHIPTMTSNLNGVRAITGGIRSTGKGYENQSRVEESNVVQGPTNHWHIGVLVADDRGLKELERRQAKFRLAESQRRGNL